MRLSLVVELPEDTEVPVDAQIGAIARRLAAGEGVEVACTGLDVMLSLASITFGGPDPEQRTPRGSWWRRSRTSKPKDPIAARTPSGKGWGTPTPQQHMLAASRFAQPGAGASLAAVAAPASTCSCAMAGPQRAAEVPPPTAPLAPPAFTAVPQAERAPQREPVCLDLASDDDDDVLA